MTKLNYGDIIAKTETSELIRRHTATRRGYCRKDQIETVEEYKGRYGAGYIVRKPYYTRAGKKSTNYELITYYTYPRA